MSTPIIRVDSVRVYDYEQPPFGVYIILDPNDKGQYRIPVGHSTDCIVLHQLDPPNSLYVENPRVISTEIIHEGSPNNEFMVVRLNCDNFEHMSMAEMLGRMSMWP